MIDLQIGTSLKQYSNCDFKNVVAGEKRLIFFSRSFAKLPPTPLVTQLKLRNSEKNQGTPGGHVDTLYNPLRALGAL